MNLLLAEADVATAGQGAASMISLVVMVVFWFGIMYFLMIRPQKKEQNRIRAMLADMAVAHPVRDIIASAAVTAAAVLTGLALFRKKDLK